MEIKGYSKKKKLNIYLQLNKTKQNQASRLLLNSYTPPELLFLVAYYISMNTMKINTFHVLFIITKPHNLDLN